VHLSSKTAVASPRVLLPTRPGRGNEIEKTRVWTPILRLVRETLQEIIIRKVRTIGKGRRPQPGENGGRWSTMWR
jgi:hypothetical protein